MTRKFNVNGDCKPELHYMADISDKIHKIVQMIEDGEYFTITRARQYGKTTTLQILGKCLQEKYEVISLDFQMLSHADFENEQSFVAAFSGEVLERARNIPEKIKEQLILLTMEAGSRNTLSVLFKCLIEWCGISEKKLVLMIDETDSAANNQVFFDFLSQLRGYYIRREQTTTFRSVILAGVYDIKNLRQKIRPDDAHKLNSPWNIAADFLVDMSFSAKEISKMLTDYDNDHHTKMDIPALSRLLYDYTSGYPFLVSRICKLMDERLADTEEFSDLDSIWTKEGFLTAVRILLSEKNTLFESLFRKLTDYPELRSLLYMLLFQGQSILYNPEDQAIDMAIMFGFVKISNASVIVANRIFETRLYNMFLALPELQTNELYRAALQHKNQFVKNGHLDMKLVLEKFTAHFDEIYGDQKQNFIEEDGRRFFLLYLKPIINGQGNYYIESRTRNLERTDVIVDYGGEQFIIEMKIWHGNAYHERGEAQLLDYLEYYHLEKGYLLSFNFNKKKTVGVKEVFIHNRTIIEAVV